MVRKGVGTSAAGLTTHEFKIDLRGLIRLLAQHLYPEPDVFIRELIQNANDALERRRLNAGSDSTPAMIRIRTDQWNRSISFQDNGQGLTETEIHEYLATIGRSGTDHFRQEILRLGRDAEASLIGRFGIGLLSSFVVAERVEILTRSATSPTAIWHWESLGDKGYTLERVETGNSTRLAANGPALIDNAGTTVTVTLSSAQKSDQFLDLSVLRQAVRKYADFVPYPIYLNDEPSPTNSVTAPWARSYSSPLEQKREYNRYLDARFDDYILHVIPVQSQAPMRLKGALYISDRRTLDMQAAGAVDVYQSGMFVQARNRDILPGWAKFVHGVVDSPDLTLTLARDGLQRDSNFESAREILGRTIIEEIKSLAREDPAKLQRLLNWHSTVIKMMAVQEDDFFDAICDLVPFETNRGPMNLQTYFQYEQNVQAEDRSRPLYYFTELLSTTLYYLLADEKGLVIVDASGAFDEEFLEAYAKHHDVTLQLITAPESASLFSPLDQDENQQFGQLEVEFRRMVPDRNSHVRMVRFRPTHLPAVMMPSASAKAYRELEYAKENVRLPESLRKVLEQASETKVSLPMDVFVNVDNPTIQKLRHIDLRSHVAQSALASIYNNALLLATPAISRSALESITKQSHQVVDLLVDGVAQLETVKSRLSATETQLTAQGPAEDELTEHVSAFVALPFAGAEALFGALRKVVEDNPYFWQLVRADEEQLDPTIYGSVHKHISRAHVFFVDISKHNFNVGLELGLMQRFPTRPKILLRGDDSPPEPVDLKGAIYVSYPSGASERDVAAALKEQLPKIKQLRSIRGSKRYLSPVLLNGLGVDMALAEALARDFVTAEEFVSASASEVANAVGLGSGLVEELQSQVGMRLGLS